MIGLHLFLDYEAINFNSNYLFVNIKKIRIIKYDLNEFIKHFVFWNFILEIKG